MNNDPVSSLPGPLNSGWSFLNSHRKQQLKIIKLEKKEKISIKDQYLALIKKN